MSFLKRLSSLKLTLPLMVLLLLAVLYGYRLSSGSTIWVAIPLVLLAINLLAALLVNPRFRRQGGLLIFHLCLLGILLLSAIGQMTSLKARLELTEGQWFDARQLQDMRRGPWHPLQQLQKISFLQGPVQVSYSPGLIRGNTRSEVTLVPGGKDAASLSIGDNLPLRIAGYSFYTSSNKGFALLLTWQGEDGNRLTGSVNLPSYPMNDWQLKRQWTTPAGEVVEFRFDLDRAAPHSQAWVLTEASASGSLTAITADRQDQLQPGKWIKAKGGRIRFNDVRLWMGYEVFFNPLLPWLFATAMIGVCGLAVHYWGRLGLRMQTEANPGRTAGAGKHAHT